MTLLDGKAYREELLKEYKKEIEDKKLDITLAIIQIGNDPSSITYIKNKIKYCDMVGIRTRLHYLGSKTTNEELKVLINKLNVDESITGIILQSPVPKGIDYVTSANMINPKKDIDGFTKDNIYKLYNNQKGIVPCTPKGVVKLLKHYNINLVGKKVALLGRGLVAGRPLMLMLENENATVTLCHSKTKNLKDITSQADIVISAVGKPNLVTKDMVKDGFIGVDIGLKEVDGKLHGDFDFEGVKDKASFITPSPGGVGPMTISMIIENLIEAKKEQGRNV